MAGPTRNELVMEIGKLLSIWSKLKANDKQNCKQLIDTKIRTLRDCKRPQFEGPYAFMDIVVALESKLVAAKFDLGSITVVISKEMEDLMNKIGLQYSRGEVGGSRLLFLLPTFSLTYNRVDFQMPRSSKSMSSGVSTSRYHQAQVLHTPSVLRRIIMVREHTVISSFKFKGMSRWKQEWL